VPGVGGAAERAPAPRRHSHHRTVSAAGSAQALRDDYPDFTPFIREDLTEPLIDALHRGELDLLLLALPVAAEGVETMHLFDDPFISPARGSPLAHREQVVTTDSLRGQELLLLEDGHCLREHALEACKLRGARIHVCPTRRRA
jgi:LysR family hydrogen peroxide-inducible transcriptional activator